jgi:hypothetical protein
MKLPNAVALAALLGCVILTLLLLRARNDLALANAALASVKSAHAEMTARVGNLESKVIDDAQLKRLQSDQREAIKMRGELSTLKKSLAAAQQKAAAAATAAKSSASQPVMPADPPTNAYARVQSRKLNATLPLGHGLLFGGWETEPGKQTFAMATPNLDPANPGVVTVRTKIFEITDAALGKLDSTMLIRAAGQQATITADQLPSFQKTLETTPGVEVTSSEMILTSGSQGRAFIGNQLPTPDGTIDVGTSMNFTPTIAADGATINLAVDAKLTLPNIPPPAAQ